MHAFGLVFSLNALIFLQLNADNESLNLKEAVSEFKRRLKTVLNLNNVKRLSVVYEQ